VQHWKISKFHAVLSQKNKTDISENKYLVSFGVLEIETTFSRMVLCGEVSLDVDVKEVGIACGFEGVGKLLINRSKYKR
jgi:hypothetical protein